MLASDVHVQFLDSRQVDSAQNAIMTQVFMRLNKISQWGPGALFNGKAAVVFHMVCLAEMARSLEV